MLVGVTSNILGVGFSSLGGVVGSGEGGLRLGGGGLGGGDSRGGIGVGLGGGGQRRGGLGGVGLGGGVLGDGVLGGLIGVGEEFQFVGSGFLGIGQRLGNGGVDGLRGGEIPGADDVVFMGGDEELAVRGPGHGGDFAGLLQLELGSGEFAVGKGPNVVGAIGGAGEELLVVRREGDVADGHLVAGEGLDGGAGVGVDETDVVALGDGERLAIGAERDDRGSGVERNIAESFDGLTAPKFYFAVTAAGKEVAGLVEGKRVNKVTMADPVFIFVVF